MKRWPEKAAFSATYKSVWCAGPSIEFIHQIEPVAAIVERLIKEYEVSFDKLLNLKNKWVSKC